MKKCLIISTILIITFVIILINNSNKPPFETLTIFEEQIAIKHNKLEYNIETDCSAMSEPNEQIINYKLNKKYQNSHLSISTKAFDSSNNLIETYENINKLTISINIEKYNYKITVSCR